MAGRSPEFERPDVAIAALAARQHGVVTRQQLLGLGIGPDAIDHRLKSDRLHRVHVGVYLVGHSAEPPHARVMAAVLACGDGAVVSHRSAAALWGLLSTQPVVVEVTVPRAWRPRRSGVRAHSAPGLGKEEVADVDGVPVTSTARTLLDLAGLVRASVLESALADAYARGLLRRDELIDQLERNPTRRGTAALRRLLAGEGEPAFTRSEAEARFLHLLRRSRIPAPEVNVRVGYFEVDFLWRAQRLIVEVDGYAFHSNRVAFERDRLRDAELQALGFRVFRVTWRQMMDPASVVGRITRALRRSRDPP